jgi:hypothetical protein
MSQNSFNLAMNVEEQEEPSHPLMPEKDLWYNVLRKGVEDAAGDAVDGELYRAEARAWVLDQTNEQVGSFLWICTILDIDPTYLRKKLLKLFKAKRKKQWEETGLENEKYFQWHYLSNSPKQ